jgi:hypothetical protein
MNSLKFYQTLMKCNPIKQKRKQGQKLWEVRQYITNLESPKDEILATLALCIILGGYKQGRSNKGYELSISHYYKMLDRMEKEKRNLYKGDKKGRIVLDKNKLEELFDLAAKIINRNGNE